MILALAGGVGGAKLASGLASVLPVEQLTIAVNTGDDFEHLGLHVSPDLDTVMYNLAGVNDPVNGWGLAGETWRCLEGMERLGGETWFRLGDRDLATHLERTRRLKAGDTLSSITRDFCRRLRVDHAVVPMSDDPVRTMVHTTDGVLAFQDYFVRRRAQPVVTTLEFADADRARIAPGFRAALEDRTLSAIVVCPSNPYLSVAPIMAVPGVADLLRASDAPCIAVSPIVGGQALKGPAAKIMSELGKEPSSLEIARHYRGWVDALVIDRADATLVHDIEALGMTAFVTNTIMNGAAEKAALAREVIALAKDVSVKRKRTSHA